MGYGPRDRGWRAVAEAGGAEGASAERLSPAEAIHLWRAAPRLLRTPRSAPLLVIPGLGPATTGRSSAERLVQRVAVLGLTPMADIWLPSRRGPLPRGTTIANLAADHARAIRSRFARPVDVLDESTGGSIALQLAIDHPDVVRRLALVSAASSLGDQGRIVQREIARHVRLRRPRRAAALLLGTTTTHPVGSALLRIGGHALGRMAVGRTDDLIRLIEAEDGFDVQHGLHRVTAPTLLIGGLRDGYYSPDRFRATAAGLAHVSYVEHADGGHLTALTSRAVRAQVRRHLRSER